MSLYEQALPLMNFNATRPPNGSDDARLKFSIGSIWGYDGKIWRGDDFTTNGSAVWTLVGSISFTQTIIGDGDDANDTRIIVHGKNTATPSVQLWYEYNTGQWRQLDVTQGITSETATPNQLSLNLLAYEGNQTSNKYSIIVQ